VPVDEVPGKLGFTAVRETAKPEVAAEPVSAKVPTPATSVPLPIIIFGVVVDKFTVELAAVYIVFGEMKAPVLLIQYAVIVTA